MLVTIPMDLEIGKRCLISELDQPTANDFGAYAVVTRQFDRNTLHFGPSCPTPILDAAIDLILSHWNEFSWHGMDLSCIQDVPYTSQYTDNTPCTYKSRRHNYAPRNSAPIEARS